MSAFRDRLRAHVAATHGIVAPEPLPAPIVAPEPVQRVTRPRIAITQPTDADESVTLRVLKQRDVKVCTACGQTYQPTMPHQVLCGNTACRRAQQREWARKRRSVERIEQPETRTCPICGATMQVDVARRGQRRRTYCSDSCRNRATYLRACGIPVLPQ